MRREWKMQKQNSNKIYDIGKYVKQKYTEGC